jgi:hypothetical protein
MRTATPPAATRTKTDVIAEALDHARQADLNVTVDDQEDTVVVGCPRCTKNMAFRHHYWYPPGAARLVDIFVYIHQPARSGGVQRERP